MNYVTLALVPRTEAANLGRFYVFGEPERDVLAEIDRAFANLPRKICPSVLCDSEEDRRIWLILLDYYRSLSRNHQPPRP